MVSDSMDDKMVSDSMDDKMTDKNFMPLIALDLKMMGGHMYSPGMQVSNGINPSDVICKSGLELMMRVYNGDPVCVKHSSVEKLLVLGFADFF